MDMPGLFFVGPPTHSLDHRKSAGGFIHGFRYTGLNFNIFVITVQPLVSRRH